jgi:SmpA / OmlA family
MTVSKTLALLVVLTAGCASYSGDSLVPGRSTASDVQALMGAPDEKLPLANGDSEWFYARPQGRQTFAVTLSTGGVVKSVEQRLTEENLARLRAGTSTRHDVRTLLGPPGLVSRLPRQQREVWEYRMHNAEQDDYFLYAQFSDDGVLRELLMLRDVRNEVAGDKG